MTRFADPIPSEGAAPAAPAAPAESAESATRHPRALAGLSIVLPCFNEEDNVADAIRYSMAAASRVSVRHEVIVVDDGSTDATAEIAAEFVRAEPRVRLIAHTANRGYGDALRSGMRAAREPWLLLMDSDLQFHPGEVEDFLPFAGDHDLIVGWRMQRRDPLGRRMNAAAWNWLVRRLFNLPIRDVDCAFKLVRRETLERFELTSSGAMISTELVVKALASGARLRELGVHHRPRVAGEQSGANPRVVARAFRELAVLHRTLRGLTPAAGTE